MAQTGVITTGSFPLPDHLAKGIIAKVQDGSVLAKLCTTEPQIQHGKTDFITFTQTPKAELVGESGEKTNSTANFGSVTSKTYKVQVTVRMSDEVLYEDKEYQLNALSTLTSSLDDAISRAVDLVGIHAINPLTGTVSENVTNNLTTTTNSVTVGDFVEADFENALALLVANDSVPSAIALDPIYAFKMRSEKYSDGRRKYPDIPMNIRNLGSVEGLSAAVSNTVAGRPEAAADTKIKAIMGDFSKFRWGMVDRIPVETIQYGDPDGQGDLKHYNQIALRAEAYFGFLLIDKLAFTKFVSAA